MTRNSDRNRFTDSISFTCCPPSEWIFPSFSRPIVCCDVWNQLIITLIEEPILLVWCHWTAAPMMSFPGALADAAGGEAEDDRHDGERGEERRLPGALQRPQRVSLSAGEKTSTHIKSFTHCSCPRCSHSDGFSFFSFFVSRWHILWHGSPFMRLSETRSPERTKVWCRSTRRSCWVHLEVCVLVVSGVLVHRHLHLCFSLRYLASMPTSCPRPTSACKTTLFQRQRSDIIGHTVGCCLSRSSPASCLFCSCQNPPCLSCCCVQSLWEAAEPGSLPHSSGSGSVTAPRQCS